MFSKSSFIPLGIGVVIGAVAMFGVTALLPEKNNGVTLLRGNIEQLPDGQSRYTNTRYNFSLMYPSELVVQEFEESENTMSVIFQKPGEERGFQMFVTPYTENTITEARIKTDIPSGVVNNPVEVLIGKVKNIRALHFNSEVSLIGASAEVWFIHEGHLYEVTTYAALDEWLADILNTLQFM